MDLEWLKPAAFMGSILYALVGVVLFWLCFLLIDKISPYDLWGEIVEKQNRALGMVVAAVNAIEKIREVNEYHKKLVFAKHYANIMRLINGNEPHIGQRCAVKEMCEED